MIAAGKRSRFSPLSLFLDVAFTLVAMFAALLALAKIVPEDAKKKTQTEATALALGNISVEARWPDGVDADVDLWVKAPADKKGVGYSRRVDLQSAYVRDDVGAANDPGRLNFENVFVRGVRPGLHVVNLHLYARNGTRGPIRVDVRVTRLPQTALPGEELVATTVYLTTDGTEVTVASFNLDAKGRLVPGSRSRRLIHLRSQER